MLWMVLAAAGAPTYLLCTLEQEPQPLAVEIVTNEAAQQAVVALPSGRVVTRQAIFSPTEVRIPDDRSLWIVNRVDLRFERQVAISDPPSISRGQCEVKPAPAERAF